MVQKLRCGCLMIFYCLAISASCFATGGIMNGSGTTAAPYQVADYLDLKAIGKTYSLAAEYRLIADIDASASSADDGGKGFLPIGNDTLVFQGVFHGGGHVIKNLVINRPAGTFIGLFGYIKNSTLDSIRLQNDSIAGLSWVGGLVGCSDSSTIIYCSASGIVTGLYEYAGGLVGYLSSSLIGDCFVKGTVSGNGDCGGVVGMSFLSAAIRRCSAAVCVNGYNAVGGLAGTNQNTVISDCHATGNVSGYMAVGGLVGYNHYSSLITNCYATGNMSGNANVGGLAGISYSPITNCYATGNTNGTTYVGGIAGQNRASIALCYATGNVFGSVDVGGIAGMNYTYAATLNACYAAGRVTGSSNTGGVLGYNYSPCTIQDCFWNTITTGQGTSSGVNEGADSSIGLSTASMRMADRFSGWDFDTLWSVRNDSTYPGLRNIDNAPFAFADSLRSGRSFALAALLANDCDVETTRKALILKIVSAKIGSTDSISILTFPASAIHGTVDTLEYRVGEVRTAYGDTLWGNCATALIMFDTTITGISTTHESAPKSFSLHQNYPNPFNPTTVIRYQLPVSGNVSLKVYDVLGREVATLVNEIKSAGSYSVTFNAATLASGMYFYQMKAGSFLQTKKMVLMK